MRIEIPTLHRIEPAEQESAYQMMIRAFRKYPKLLGAFPDEKDRMAGIEAVIRYYGAYDFYYGDGYSLDSQVTECALMMHSDDLDFSDEARMRAAGCENALWRSAMDRLSADQQALWFAFFEELDRQEQLLDLPEEYLYIDLFAVDPACQHRGRGRRVIGEVTRWADEHRLPIMLFTNGDYDIRFYQSLGFEIAGVTSSEEFGFENTYVLYGA